MLDVAGSHDPKATTLSLSLVNRSLSDSVDADVSTNLGIEEILSATTISDSDPKAYNTWDFPDVIIPFEGAAQREVDGRVTVSLPPLSHTVVRMRVAPGA